MAFKDNVPNKSGSAKAQKAQKFLDTKASQNVKKGGTLSTMAKLLGMTKDKK
jgi:hypothetical protein